MGIPCWANPRNSREDETVLQEIPIAWPLVNAAAANLPMHAADLYACSNVCAPPGPVAVPPTHTPAEIDIQTPDTQTCVYVGCTRLEGT